jgi:flagellar hook-associated protein FlgK
MYIAASGLNASRTAMDAVAENLANANTASYVRERVNLAASPSLDINGVGSGVEVASISQVANAVLAATALAGQSSLAYASTAQQIAQSIQEVFPEPNGSSGISTQLSNFWNSWDQIAADPTALAPRTEVVAQAQSLATSINLTATDLSQLAASTTSQLQQVVDQVNTYDVQVAQLNSQIVQAKATGADVNSLIDQRNQIVTELGKYIGVTARQSQDGSISLSVGGVMLVQDTSVTELGLTLRLDLLQL